MTKSDIIKKLLNLKYLWDKKHEEYQTSFVDCDWERGILLEKCIKNLEDVITEIARGE